MGREVQALHLLKPLAVIRNVVGTRSTRTREPGAWPNRDGGRWRSKHPAPFSEFGAYSHDNCFPRNNIDGTVARPLR
jgi:hypothetical protein